MTAVAKLLPCPFCGSQPKSGWQGASVPGMEDCGYWGIDCCNAFAHAGMEQDAAAQWNRRAALSPAELGGVEVTTEMAMRLKESLPMGCAGYLTIPNCRAALENALAYATPRAAEADWLPIESAPKANGLYVVYTPDLGDGERYGFDYYEDGVWLEHADAYDHYIAVGDAGAAGPDCVCTGPGPDPDYTHWRALTPPSAKGE